MKVYIAIPSCRDWKPQFGASLCGLVKKMTIAGVDSNMNVQKPWFETRWMPERNSFIGEDYFFCGQVRNAHIGDFTYREGEAA